MTERGSVPRREAGSGVSKMKVIGLSGWSGAGKTTLLTRVIRI